MFIGNNTTTSTESLVGIQAESAGYMDPVEEALHNVAVDEANYNQILGCLAVAEVTAARQGLDPTSVYTEGTISDFWGKIKEFFKKIWAKIKGLWAKLVATFDQHAKSGKEFFDKYKKTLADKFNKIDKDKIKFSGYKFVEHDILDVKAANYDITSVAKTLSKDDDDDKVTENEEKFRGELIGESGSFTMKEMTKELHDKLRDGGSKESDLDFVNFSYISKILGNSDKALENCKKEFRDVEKTVEKNIKEAEKNQNKRIDASVEKPDDQDKSDEVAIYGKAIRIVKSNLASFQAAASVVITAHKDEISQAKGFAAQVLRAGVRDGFKEGAGVGTDASGNSVFGTLKLA